MNAQDTIRPTGHCQVRGKRGSRAYYAFIRDAEGRHKRRLGPAWVKDSGKRTPRGAVKWVARDGTKPDGYLTPAEADDMLRQMLAEAPRGSPSHRETHRRTAITLRDACDHWLRWAERDSEVKHSTLSDYRNMCDRMCRELGPDAAVASLTSGRIQRWLDSLRVERRLSPKEAQQRRATGAKVRRLPDGTHVQVTEASTRTRRKYLLALNGIMKRALKLGIIETNPVRLVDRPGRLRNRRSLSTAQFLRPAEVRALVGAATDVKHQDGVMFMVSAFCGLRLGELLDLRLRAIDFTAASIHVESNYVRNTEDTPKSGAGRAVPMAPEVARALRGHLATLTAQSDSSLVFVGRRGEHVDANKLRLRFYSALDRAALKQIRIHDLRHTFGTVCAAKGIPLTTIKEWMGHADLATTEIYTAFYPQASDAAKISAAFAEEPATGPDVDTN